MRTKSLIAIIIWGFLMITNLISQETFSKFYNVYVGIPYGNEFANSLIVTGEGYYLAVGSICENPELSSCGNLLFTDKAGNLKWRKNITWFRGGDRETIVKHGSILYIAGTKDGRRVSDGNAYILKVNMEGDSIGLMHDYFHDSYEKWGGPVSMVYLDNHLYTINHHYAFTTEKFPELMKWDLSGNVVFDKLYYDEIGKVAYSFGLIPTRDNNLIMVYRYLEQDNFTAELLKVNQNGEKIWKRSFKTNNIANSPRVIELQDGSLVLEYVYKIQDLDSLLLQKWAPYSLRLVKLSADGKSKTWQHQFDRKPYYRTSGLQLMIPAKNGDIIGAGGYHSVYLGDSSNYSVGWIFRMSPEGELLWEHFYQDEGYPGEYGLRSVREDEDGSIIAVGKVYLKDSTIQDNNYTWMLKVDSMGCLTPGCKKEDTIQYITTDIIDVPYPNQNIKIYPNPVDEILSIDMVGTYNLKEWNIFDIIGRKVKTGKVDSSMELDVSSLKSGIYFLHLVHKSGLKYVSKFIKQ